MKSKKKEGIVLIKDGKLTKEGERITKTLEKKIEKGDFRNMQKK